MLCGTHYHIKTLNCLVTSHAEALQQTSLEPNWKIYYSTVIHGRNRTRDLREVVKEVEEFCLRTYIREYVSNMVANIKSVPLKFLSAHNDTINKA